jgi:hypothetical protein
MSNTNSLSTTAIYQAINALDAGGSNEGISYHLTSNNSLSQKPPWWVFIPYGSWANPLTPPIPSPLEDAILEEISAAPTATGQCFIDVLYLAHLESKSDPSFFDDPNASQTIACALATFVNNLPSSVTPVIRYLIGSDGAQEVTNDRFVQALFGAGITHSNTWLYYGNFSPAFALMLDTDAVQDIAPSSPASSIKLPASYSVISNFWKWLLSEIEKVSTEIYNLLKDISVSTLLDWSARLLEAISGSSLTWNHSKIFAINGVMLVTGGANYWSRYATGQTWLFDTAMSLTGEAAADSHRFANYLWQYLANIPLIDDRSQSLGSPVTNSGPDFQTMAAPLYDGSPTYTGTLNALSVGKNGNWGFTFDSSPAQIFDALRDFFINVIAAIEGNGASNTTAHLVNVLSDTNPTVQQVLGDLGVNPTCWASRYARNFAVSQANLSVRLNQQKIVMDDLVGGSKTFQDLVAEINATFNCNWNGYIWPFDFISAMGYALSNMSNNGSASPLGFQIVCSCPTASGGGYEDPVTVQTFTDTLASVMAGMKNLGYINPNGDIPKIIANLLVYKRIDNQVSSPLHANHSKVVLVDDVVCYIGSDNAYPSYNIEFGLWIDDQTSIQDYINKFWSGPNGGLWGFAQQP